MKKETDKLTQAHLAEVQKELAELREGMPIAEQKAVIARIAAQ